MTAIADFIVIRKANGMNSMLEFMTYFLTKKTMETIRTAGRIEISFIEFTYSRCALFVMGLISK
jgi:hypothetical protein